VSSLSLFTFTSAGITRVRSQIQQKLLLSIASLSTTSHGSAFTRESASPHHSMLFQTHAPARCYAVCEVSVRVLSADLLGMDPDIDHNSLFVIEEKPAALLPSCTV
jgi:hypothetical protein